MPRHRARTTATIVAAVGLFASATLGTALLPAASTSSIDHISTERASLESEWSQDLWDAASAGDARAFRTLLDAAAEAFDDPTLALSAEALSQRFLERDDARAVLIAEQRQELAEHWGAFQEADQTEDRELALLDGLGAAITLHMLTGNDASVLGEATVRDLVAAAEASAALAEGERRWFQAAELYDRLHGLYEFDARYLDDRTRAIKRLALVAIYAPKRNHELRSERLVAAGEDPLPPFNPSGVSVDERLDGIKSRMVEYALALSDARHVEGTPYRDLMISGIRALQLLVDTSDLYESFPQLQDAENRATYRGVLERQLVELRDAPAIGPRSVRTLIDRVQEWNRQTIALPDELILRVFGDGAMAALDEYSEIIWPDDVTQFERSTRGNFSGIGVSIHMNERREIEVVTPLDGTPAQRAGVRAEDVVVGVNGERTYGFTLNQAVEKITGPKSTPVDITVRRGEGDDAEEITYTIVRDTVELKTVKGWERIDATDDNWNWMIDAQRGIGYVRLTGFTENTTADFGRAITEMQRAGLQGLILDLRFNRGGLLDQAVEITSRFVDYADGRNAYGRVVVSTRNNNGDRQTQSPPERLINRPSPLPKLPVVVLINEGSASASEIVAGAIQDYTEASAARAIILGQTTYGKGSVQNVLAIDTGPSPRALMKLTTQYYVLPGGRMIHRRPGREEHGVTPDLAVQMLPERVAESLRLRQEADVLVLDENGDIPAPEDRADPDALISEGLDLQLHAALVLLQSQTKPTTAAAMLDQPEDRRTP
ncbi:MAG: S41 family peptidase [Planctomycetota bacterium]